MYRENCNRRYVMLIVKTYICISVNCNITSWPHIHPSLCNLYRSHMRLFRVNCKDLSAHCKLFCLFCKHLCNDIIVAVMQHYSEREKCPSAKDLPERLATRITVETVRKRSLQTYTCPVRSLALIAFNFPVPFYF